MSRVFVLEKPAEDSPRFKTLDKAGDFGKLVYIYDGVSRRPSIFSEEFKKETSKRFIEHQFDPETDFFAVYGYIVPIVLCVTELLLDYDEFKVLFFSGQDQHFLPRRLGEKGSDITDEIKTEITESCDESGSISS